VEHPFPVIKRQSGYPMTRYRGLVKYRAQPFMLFTLGNLCLMRRKLMAWRSLSIGVED
jgi:IS5 family transposase